MDYAIADTTYQDEILPHVSRTFALTIPQLPARLRQSAANAYLLCRIADTVEDEPALPAPETLAFLQRFKEVVAGRADPVGLSRDLMGRLSERTLPAERDLVANMDRVIRVTAGLDPQSRAAIERCVELMCYGMPRFQHNASLRGLPRSTDLDAYCYYVAGVVGEMLTELFCSYSADIARHRLALHDLAASFGQGLQMTNILKDVWEDRSRGACWLPQEVFARHNFDVETLTPERYDGRFTAGMEELIGIAHGHLRNALAFTLLIPAKETGIRRFCLWAIGLAVLTLQRIRRHPRYTSGAAVKVSRSAVTMTRTLTELTVRNNWALRQLFDLAARGLPLAEPSEVRRARIAPMLDDQSSPSPPAPSSTRIAASRAPTEAELAFADASLRADRSSAS
jgi:farnesyl-diphosphate farnesyltransferase